MFNRYFTQFSGIALAVSLVCGAGCTRKQQDASDPKQRLNAYISQSFDVRKVDDRDSLMAYLTGPAKVRLAAWSPEQFREAFIESKREFVKLVFSEIKPVSPTETNITYELTYIDKGKSSNAKVTHKKLCQLVQDQGGWFIKDVRSIKELVEYQNEMSLP